MKYQFPFLLLLLISILPSCKEESPLSTETEVESTRSYPQEFINLANQYGGLEEWNKYQSMEYYMVKNGQSEKHCIDLKTREVRIENDQYTLVKNDEGVYVAPGLDSFPGSSPRFYHNLYFYFFSIPYVLSDPGVHYETLGDYLVDGVNYHAIKYTFGENVGDAPDDYYITLMDKETKQMKYLLYTVTYYSQEPSQKFNILEYANWTKVKTLSFPTKLIGYKFDEGKIGDKRYETAFEKIDILKAKFPAEMFVAPEGGEKEE